jgi:hypothetical protein
MDFVSVWAGITDDFVIGLCVTRVCRDGANYPKILEEKLPFVLEGVALREYKSIFVVSAHDAPPHFARQLRVAGCGGLIT